MEILLLILMVACATRGHPQSDMNCQEIFSSSDEIDGSNTPSPIDVNTCIDRRKHFQKSCIFDTDSCESHCHLGYVTDANGCPSSCECKLEGLFEGDIQIELDDFPLLIEAYDEPPPDMQHAAANDLPRWDEERINGRVKIPYVIKSDMSSKAKTAINSAIERFSQDTCIDFIPRENQANYLIFTSSGGCWSFVGRRGGAQLISIGNGCEWIGIVQHEILHALGFWHEQSRPDRDNFVEIKLQNVVSNMKHNFEKRKNINSLGSEYDKGSVMHYGGYAFSQNRLPTIVDKATNQPVRAQREGLSESDKDQVNKMYRCNGGGSVSAQWNSWGQWSSCSKTCGIGSRRRTRTCMKGGVAIEISQCSGSSVDQRHCKVKDCEDTSTGEWGEWGSWSTCSVTCGGGYHWRYRRCNGKGSQTEKCVGSPWQTQKCNTEDCLSNMEFRVLANTYNFCTHGQLKTGDFNGDGNDDLLCVYSEGSAQIIMSGTKSYFAHSSWEGMTSFCMDGENTQGHVADFNGDGSDDFMCIEIDSGKFKISFSNGGKFKKEPDGSGTIGSFCNGDGERLVVSDVNRDKKADLICRKYGGITKLALNIL